MKFAVKLLMQFNPNMTETEALRRAKNLYENTKGKKVKAEATNASQQTKSEQEVVTDDKPSGPAKIWDGGSESHMFNKLEEIARSELPETPVLNARITRTLEPKKVDHDVKF